MSSNSMQDGETGWEKSNLSTLAGICERYLQQLEEFETSSESVKVERVRDAHGRFRVWGWNIGAFAQQNPKLSLDFRLRDSTRVRRAIHSNLQDLHEFAERCTFPILNNAFEFLKLIYALTSLSNCFRSTTKSTKF